MSISLIKIVTQVTHHYYILITFITINNTSFTAFSTDKITTYIRKNLDINFTESLSSDNNSDTAFNFNKQTNDIEI